MKKKLFSLTIIGILLGFLFSFFAFSSEIYNSIILGCNIFIFNVFPSLFPMFVISNILVNIGFANLLGELFKNIMNKVFHIKKEASFIFFMSFFSGFPSSGKYIDNLIDKGLINKDEASKILNFTFFSNPLFLINTVGVMFLNNKLLGVILIVVQAISNIIVGIIFRDRNYVNEKDKSSFKDFINHINNDSFIDLLFNSISNALKVLLDIFGIIISFLIITYVIANLFKIKNDFIIMLLCGILEVTSGLKLLSSINISLMYKFIIATFFICFGGFCVHAQIMSILKEKKISYLPFLKARFVQGIIGCIISFLIYVILL